MSTCRVSAKALRWFNELPVLLLAGVLYLQGQDKVDGLMASAASMGSPGLDELRWLDIREMDTGAALPEKIVSMNAYLGGFPIARALAGRRDRLCGRGQLHLLRAGGFARCG